MSLDEPTLQEFVRHAERYGSELVYETALAYLEPEQLGLLSLALQRIDRYWKLGRAQQAWLALALDDAGVADAEICASAHLSRVTLYRLRVQRQQVEQVADAGLDSAQPSGAPVSKADSPTGPTSRPDMKHERR